MMMMMMMMTHLVANLHDSSSSFSNPLPSTVTRVPPLCGPTDGCKLDTLCAADEGEE